MFLLPDFFFSFHDMNFLKAPTFQEAVLRVSFLLKLQMYIEGVGRKLIKLQRLRGEAGKAPQSAQGD